MIRNNMYCILLVILMCCVSAVYSSLGDRTYVFQKCLKNCSHTECLDEETFKSRQPAHLVLLGWTCYEECRHSCMWYTVDAFVKDGSPVPQFYGKWPFVRVFGLQEPASVVFSILNAASHAMVLWYRRHVDPSTPMYYVWHGMVLVSVNAWTWSTIYHSKDTDFTEMMDYFFALTIVLYNAFILFCRVVDTEKRWKPAVAVSILLAFYARHIHYLAFVRFDYGYNMTVNVVIGLADVCGWLGWCVVRRKDRYVWMCAAAMVAFNLSVMLELLDFPPLWWTLDAHALWHASTVPINLLWWRFIIADGIHLQEKKTSRKMV
ncbi:hypothetical protein ACOMHN_023413 [Nucella lapillus]